MEIIVFLSIVIAVLAVLTSIVLVRRVKKQIAEMTDEMCIRDRRDSAEDGICQSHPQGHSSGENHEHLYFCQDDENFYQFYGM